MCLGDAKTAVSIFVKNSFSLVIEVTGQLVAYSVLTQKYQLFLKMSLWSTSFVFSMSKNYTEIESICLDFRTAGSHSDFVYVIDVYAHWRERIDFFSANFYRMQSSQRVWHSHFGGKGTPMVVP